MATFGEQVRALRIARGMSLQKTADALGTFKGYVCSIEKGKTAAPSAPLVKKFAALFRMDYRETLLQVELEKIHPDVRERLQKLVEIGRQVELRTAEKKTAMKSAIFPGRAPSPSRSV